VAAQRAAALTSQLVSFARETRGDKKPIEPEATVLEALELLSTAVPKKVIINLEAEKELPMMIADPLQVQQVVMNLIINASDASPRGGTITIRIAPYQLQERETFGGGIIPPGQFVMISVSDEGTGIPPEVMERVFDPFFTTKEKGKGTGLGLSVVHGIVKNHGGFIRIDSRIGVGSRFETYFPAERGGGGHKRA